MRTLFTFTQETKLVSAVRGMLSRPAAAIVIAGSLSVLTLMASLYLFLFAGRELLPPPPIAGLTASRIFDPIPMISLATTAPTVEVAALPTAEASFPDFSSVGAFATEVVLPALVPAAVPAVPATVPAPVPAPAPAPIPANVPSTGETPTSAGYDPEDYYSGDNDWGGGYGHSYNRYSESRWDDSRNSVKKDSRSNDYRSGDKGKSARHYN